MNTQKLAAELFDLFETVQYFHLRHPTIFNYKGGQIKLTKRVYINYGFGLDWQSAPQ